MTIDRLQSALIDSNPCFIIAAAMDICQLEDDWVLCINVFYKHKILNKIPTLGFKIIKHRMVNETTIFRTYFMVSKLLTHYPA